MFLDFLLVNRQANKEKVQPVSGALAGLLSKDPDLKYMAQRAFTTYLRSIHVRSDKSIFDVTKLPHAEYAASLGLPTTPRIRFLKRGVKGGKNIQGSDEVTTQSSMRGIIVIFWVASATVIPCILCTFSSSVNITITLLYRC